MSVRDNVDVMLRIFRAVERRDEDGLRTLCQPGVEFHWPPALPYGGSFRPDAPDAIDARQSLGWAETWDPFQPSEADRRLDARVVAADNDEVVMLWRQRGISPAGERFDGQVLGLYQVRDGKLARAQMFYFDPAGAARFLASAQFQAPAPRRPAGGG